MSDDYHAAIINAVPGLRQRLEQSDVTAWLDTLPIMDVAGERLFLLGGDRLASREEAMLFYACEHRLASDAALSHAAASAPLPEDTQAISISDAVKGEE